MKRPSARVIAVLAIVVLAVGMGLFLYGTVALDPEVPLHRVRRETLTRVVSGEGNLKAVRSTPIAARSLSQSYLKIAWLVEDGARVKAGDVVVRFDPTEMEKNLFDGQSDRQSAESKIAKRRAEAQAGVKGSERDAAVAQLELDTAQKFETRDPEIFSRIAIVEAEIDQNLARNRLDHAQGARRSTEKLARTDVDLFSIERRKAEIKIRQAEDALGALVVTAPHDGIVVFRRDYLGNLPKEGDMVWGRQALADLPALDSMEAEVFVLEADAGGLRAGASARVVVESQPEVAYGATVKRVDSLPKPRVRGVPVQFFGVTLSLERTDPSVMKPGQRVLATLAVDKVEGALVAPRQAVFEREGRQVVYRFVAWGPTPTPFGLRAVRKRGAFEAVPVRLGAFSLGRVVVEEGLAEGDEIALRDPAQSLDELLKRKDEERPAARARPTS